MGTPAVANRERPARKAEARYCEHVGAREIRLYMPYAEANAVRVRTAQTAANGNHVSWLYAIVGGWGWTVCQECARRERRAG